MKSLILSILIVLLTFSAATAINEKNTKEENYRHSENEKLYEVLKDQFYELKYDLRQQIRYQNKIIDEQAVLITELRLKIKELESGLFQTTQSLRNLELEVWDMKKSSNTYQPPGRQE